MKKALFLLILILLTNSLLHSQTTVLQLTELLKEKNYAAAITLGTTACNENPTDAELHFLTATAFSENYQFERAKYYALKSTTLNSEIKSYQIFLAEIYTKLSDFGNAEKMYEKMLEMDSTNRFLLISYTSVLLKKEDYQKAIINYEKIVNDDTTNIFFLKQLAFCYSKVENYNAAIDAFRKAFYLNNTDIFVMQSLAFLYDKTEHSDWARNMLTLCIAQDSTNLVLYRKRSMYGFKAKMYLDAIKDNMYIIQQDTNYRTSQILEEIGAAYYHTEQYDSALNYLEQAFAIELQTLEINHNTCYYLALTHKNLEHYDEALRFFRLAITSGTPPYLSLFFNQIAETYHISDRREQAIAAYKEALVVEPANSIVNYKIAIIYDEMNNYKTALEYYEKYLSNALPDEVEYIEFAQKRITKMKEELHFLGQ